MKLLFFLPFVLQGVMMFVDEFYFHHRRGLSKWEKVGHPLDTLSVLLPTGFALILPFSDQMAGIYLGLASLSCLFITKDEFVHHKESPALEHWLHSLLFLLHPILFILMGYSWSQSWSWPIGHSFFFFQIYFFLVLVFMVYQIIFWNFTSYAKT